MALRSKNWRRISRVLAAAIGTCSVGAASAQTVNSWVNPIDGNWVDGTKWSLGGYADGNQHAVLAAAGSYHILLPTSLNIHAVSSSAGSNATLNFVQSTIRIDNLDVAGRLAIRPVDSGNSALAIVKTLTLSGGTLSLCGIAPADLSSALGIDPGGLVGGTGTISFDGENSQAALGVGGGTIGSAVAVVTGAQGGSLQGVSGNQGSIWARTSGKTLTVTGASISGTNFSNQGTLQVDAGTLLIQSANWISPGAIVVNGGTLALGGTLSVAGLGTFVRNGGDVLAVGTLNNTGQVLALDSTKGPWTLSGGTIRGGTITGGAGGGLLLAGAGTLNAATLATDVSIGSLDTLNLVGAWQNSASIHLNGGTLNLGGTFSHAKLGNLHRNGGTISVTGTFSNSGTVLNLDEPTRDLILTGGGAIRGGTIIGSNGLQLSGMGRLDGAGLQTTVAVETLDSLELLGSWSTSGAGSIHVNGGSVFLGGTFSHSQLDRVVRTAGTVSLTGTLDNAGNTLNLDDVTGSWYMRGGTIKGGTFSISGTAQLISTPGRGTLDGIVLDSDMTIGSSGAIIRNGLALNGRTLRLAMTEITNEVGLEFAGTQSVTGSGTIVFEGDGAMRLRPSSGTLTIGNGIVIESGLDGGVIGSISFAGTGVVNQGVINSKTAGENIAAIGTFTNLGTVAARNGARFEVAPGSLLTNYSGGALTGGSWSVFGGSTISLVGPQAITTNNASIVLDGVGSTFGAIDSLLSNFGNLTITNGRNFTTVGSLSNSGTVVIGPGSAMKVLESLTNTGTVDLNGAFIVDYTGASPLSQIVGQIGTNIISSTAASDPSKRIGYAEASALNVTTFAGLPVDSTAALLKLTFGGDTDLDGDVDVADLGRLASSWQTSSDWFGGDFDYSGTVDVNDLGLLASNWQAGVSALENALTSFGLPSASVPEPGTIALVVAGAGAVRRRRFGASI